MPAYGLPIPSDWQEEDGYLTVLFCIPNSPGWRRLIVGYIESLSWGWAWDRQTGVIVDAQKVGREIFNSMTMCDFDQMKVDIGRIATALESIDQKTSLLYTWDELVEDLENAFGTGSLVLAILNGIVGLMPNLKLKVDMTPVALWFLEWKGFKGPLLAELATMDVSLAAIAAATATGKTLDIIKTVFAGLNIAQTTALGWKDIIFGDKSLWDDLVTPIWSYFISDADGGQGGVDPDADPSNRIQVRVYADVYDDALVPKLEEIRTMLETRLTAETVAGNTRADQLETILDAIEDVLGGTFEPGA